MKVTAKYQLAYKNNLFYGGQEFELDDKDLLKYQNDVIITRKIDPSEIPAIKDWKRAKARDKQLKSSKRTTK